MVLVGLASARAGVYDPAEWRDDLADHLTGTWELTGQVGGRAAHHEVQAEWVLHHQFIRIQEKTEATSPASEQRYEAIWFLGCDAVGERYDLHLLDLFGGRFSETLGYGTRDGNAIRFVFEYPDGPFHTTYRWDPEKDSDGLNPREKPAELRWGYSLFGGLYLERFLPGSRWRGRAVTAAI